MYYSCIDSVKRDLDNQRRLQMKLRNRYEQIKDCKGTLVSKTNRRTLRTEYYIQTYEDGHKKQAYVNKARLNDAKLLKEKATVSVALSRCNKNIVALKRLLDNYRGLSIEETNSALPTVYHNSENYRQLLYGFDSGRSWLESKKKLKAKYELYRPDELVHNACDGTLTRSKSEALIIEVLVSCGIPYIYECPIYLDEKLYCPDFTCLNVRTGEVFIIEHIGRTHDSNYLDYQNLKLKQYLRNGYVPGWNFLRTYEDANGNIDMVGIHKLIQAYLL